MVSWDPGVFWLQTNLWFIAQTTYQGCHQNIPTVTVPWVSGEGQVCREGQRCVPQGIKCRCGNGSCRAWTDETQPIPSNLGKHSGVLAAVQEAGFPRQCSEQTCFEEQPSAELCLLSLLSAPGLVIHPRPQGTCDTARVTHRPSHPSSCTNHSGRAPAPSQPCHSRDFNLLGLTAWHKDPKQSNKKLGRAALIVPQPLGI